MLFRNDLYDLSATFTHIRSDINYPYNLKILDKLMAVLQDDTPPQDENIIRQALSTIDGLDKEYWYFVYHNNVYTTHAILKNKDILNLFAHAIIQLQDCLKKGEFDRAYDLADSVHCLPEIIADNNFKVPKSYWKTHIRPYRQKWDKFFLKEDEKATKSK